MLRRIPLATALVVGFLLITAAPAFATDEHDVGVTPSAWTLVVDAGAWQLVNLIVVPVLVGLITKAATTAARKVFANIAITGISTLVAGFVTVGVEGDMIISSKTLVMWVVSIVVAITGHYGIYKPLKVTGSTPDTNKLMPNSGLL